jgi:hypothetical protein
VEILILREGQTATGQILGIVGAVFIFILYHSAAPHASPGICGGGLDDRAIGTDTRTVAIYIFRCANNAPGGLGCPNSATGNDKILQSLRFTIGHIHTGNFATVYFEGARAKMIVGECRIIEPQSGTQLCECCPFPFYFCAHLIQYGMKLFSLNYVRETILICLVVVFSGILLWNLVNRSYSYAEGIDDTTEVANAAIDAATTQSEATKKKAELDAKTAAIEADATIAKAKADIAKAEADKKNAQQQLDVAQDKQSAQTKLDATTADADATIAKANAEIAKAEAAKTHATDRIEVAQSKADADLAASTAAALKDKKDANDAIG